MCHFGSRLGLFDSHGLELECDYMPFGDVVELVLPYLFEEEKVMTLLTTAALASSFSELIATLRADYFLLRWWQSELEVDRLRADIEYQELTIADYSSSDSS